MAACEDVEKKQRQTFSGIKNNNHRRRNSKRIKLKEKLRTEQLGEAFEKLKSLLPIHPLDSKVF